MFAIRPIALIGLAASLTQVATAADSKTDESRRALQEVGSFVGEWKGNGESKVGGKSTLWKESLSWGWRFKGGDGWIAVEAKDGKVLTGGELRYDSGKKVYRLTATSRDGNKQTYEGKLTRGRLVLEWKDPGTGDVHRLTLNTLADGARMILLAEVQPKGKGLFATVARVAATKEGESFAGGGKKPECIVTGGLGTMTVSYMGRTYYVCCSGCRDEVNDNPKKYVDEFEKKKK
jgi:hypothetical protein